MPHGRGAIGAKARELMKEWLVLNPYPADEWMDNIEAGHRHLCFCGCSVTVAMFDDCIHSTFVLTACISPGQCVVRCLYGSSS
jgi:hypothetical protein